TRLELLDCNTPPQIQYGEILHRSRAFSYSYCTWQLGTNALIDKVIARPGPFDLQAAVDAFLALTSDNWNAGPWGAYTPVTRQNIYDTMSGYMSNYIRWATSSPTFPNSALNSGYMGTAEKSLSDSTLAIIRP